MRTLTRPLRVGQRGPLLPVLGPLTGRLAIVAAVAANPPPDIVLTPLQGDPRPLEQWLTTFNMASVMLDPYTNESSWILPTAVRLLDASANDRDDTALILLAETDPADGSVAHLPLQRIASRLLAAPVEVISTTMLRLFDRDGHRRALERSRPL